jgi:putative transposase
VPVPVPVPDGPSGDVEFLSVGGARARPTCAADGLSARGSSCGFPLGGGCAPWLSTMVRLQLDDRQWQKIAAVLSEKKRVGRPGLDDRNFVEAVLWWRRTGVPWRDLPSEFGPWKTVFNRFDRWASRGIWDEWHSIDSTINRAHQHAAGAKGGPRSMASAALVAA